MAADCMDKLDDFLYEALYSVTRRFDRAKYEAGMRLYHKRPRFGDELVSRLPLLRWSPEARKKNRDIDNAWLDEFAETRALDTVRVIKVGND